MGEQLTRNEQVSGSSPLVSSNDGGISIPNSKLILYLCAVVLHPLLRGKVNGRRMKEFEGRNDGTSIHSHQGSK